MNKYEGKKCYQVHEISALAVLSQQAVEQIRLYIQSIIITDLKPIDNKNIKPNQHSGSMIKNLISQTPLIDSSLSFYSQSVF